MDSINKYFDVIVEEEEDDERQSQAAANSDLESEESEYSENGSIYYPDSEDENEEDMETAGGKPVFKSTSNIRGMLSQVMSKVTSNVGASKEVLIQRLKTNLKGSQISLCEQ